MHTIDKHTIFYMFKNINKKYMTFYNNLCIMVRVGFFTFLSRNVYHIMW